MIMGAFNFQQSNPHYCSDCNFDGSKSYLMKPRKKETHILRTILYQNCHCDSYGEKAEISPQAISTKKPFICYTSTKNNALLNIRI